MSEDRPMQIYRRLFGYALRYRLRLLLAVIATGAASLSMLALPWLAGNVFRDAVAGRHAHDVYRVLFYMLVAIGAMSVSKYVSEAQLTFVSLRLVENLRRQVMGKLLHLPITYFVKTSAGDAISRCFSDVSRLRAFLNYAVLSLGGDLLMMLGALIALVRLSPRLTLLTASMTPVGLLIFAITARRVRRGYQKAQEHMSEMTGMLAEQVNAMAAIRAFGGQEHEKERFGRKVEQLFGETLRTDLFQAGSKALINFIVAVAVIFVLGYGATVAISNASMSGLTSDGLVKFALYAALLAEPITRLSRTNYEIQQSLAAGRRVFELLDMSEEHQTFTRRLTERPEGALAFEAIDFAYRPGQPVLSEMNLAIEPGQTVALVGPSGAGKSTLSYLPLRLYEPLAGRVTLDDHDVHDICSADLRQHIGWVGQEPFVFSGTIAENIGYGSWDADRAAIEEAARLACADDFIRRLPSGYDSRIGERGVDLSGGQRARLAIARVILRSPAVVIFDECTAALDTETESRLWRQLEQWRAKRTTLIIAHRLLTILDCPRIVVLERGKIVGDGAADQLQRTCETFNRLFEEQMNLSPQPAGES